MQGTWEKNDKLAHEISVHKLNYLFALMFIALARARPTDLLSTEFYCNFYVFFSVIRSL